MLSTLELSSPARKSMLPMGVFLSSSILDLLRQSNVELSKDTISIGDGFPVHKEISSAKKLFSKNKPVQIKLFSFQTKKPQEPSNKKYPNLAI